MRHPIVRGARAAEARFRAAVSAWIALPLAMTALAAAAGPGFPLAPVLSTLQPAAAGSTPPRPLPPRVPGPAVKPPTPPASRCTPPSGDPISADQILADLGQGKNVDLQGKIIDGSLDADAAWPAATADRKSSLRIIRGRLRLDSCRVTGRFSFPRCAFVQDIVLSCAEILGDVDLSESELRGSLLADRARIVGELRLTNATLDRDLNLRKASLEGRLDLTGARLHTINLLEGELQRNLEAVHMIAAATDMSVAKIGGNARFEDVIVLGPFNARDATFGKSLTLSSVRVDGAADLGGSSVAADTYLSDLVVDADLVLPRTFEGPVIINDVSVGRNLGLSDGQFHEVTIQRLQVRESSKLDGSRYLGKLEIGETDFGKAFNAHQTIFSGSCEFRRVRFPGTDPMAGASFAHMPTLIETTLPRTPTVTSDTGEEQEPEEPQDENENP